MKSIAFDSHVQESHLYSGQHGRTLICVEFTVPHVHAESSRRRSQSDPEAAPIVPFLSYFYFSLFCFPILHHFGVYPLYSSMFQL